MPATGGQSYILTPVEVDANAHGNRQVATLLLLDSTATPTAPATLHLRRGSATLLQRQPAPELHIQMGTGTLVREPPTLETTAMILHTAVSLPFSVDPV